MSRDAATRAHLDRLSELGCICCLLLYGEATPAEIHHPRQFAGAGQRSPDWLAFGLCYSHHRGTSGVHGDRSVLRQLKTDEAGLLAEALKRVYG